MKKIIATIIRVIMPKVIEKHEREKKAKHDYYASVMQNLLNKEHFIRDEVNSHFNAVYTTKEALKVARIHGMNNYSSFRALEEADFQQIRERINDNEDEPDTLLTINPYSILCATNDATNDARQKSKF